MENTGSSKNAEMCILKHQKARKMHWDGHKMTLKRDMRDEAQKRRNTTECDRKRRVLGRAVVQAGSMVLDKRILSSCCWS